MKKFSVLALTVFGMMTGLAQTTTIKGRVVDENNKPMPYATVYVEGTQIATQTNEKGEYVLTDVGSGKQSIKASFVGYASSAREITINKGAENINFLLVTDSQLDNITVYGRSNKSVKELQNLTRLPLGIQDQVQSITLVPEHVITDQGALSITDVARNVAGVTQFNSYGGVKESMSIRGFRGTPVLRNGVSMDSDFRTSSAIADMQGVESVEVIKGSAAVLQGIGNGLGAAGGVINLVTKTPNFRNKREVSFRAGSYGQVRPTVDFEQVLDKKESLSFRFNGAYERGDGWRKGVSNEHYYLNPTLSWKIDDKTKLTLELEYLNSDKTPDRGTINLGPDHVEALYKMPHDKFLGYSSDNFNVESVNYLARFERKINEKLSFRVSAINSIYKTDNYAAGIGLIKGSKDYALRNRTFGRDTRDDKNAVVQVDLVGKDIFTGILKHTFQVGFDYRQNTLQTGNYKGYVAGQSQPYTEQINVLGEISNQLPSDVVYKGTETGEVVTPTIGFMAQDYVQIGDKLGAMLGVRYNRLNGNVTKGATVDAWDPILGLIFKPEENISTFVSYTTTTSLRQSNSVMADGGHAGAARTKQVEFGFKTNWMNDRLGVNFSYFFINQNNLLAQVMDDQGQGTNTFEKVGSLKRNGFEIEVNGQITNNLEVMLGYSNLIARYQDSPQYVDGSAPMNAPEHTANGWLNYKVTNGMLRGLTVGAGVYYVGGRPINEYSRTGNNHGNSSAGETGYQNTRPFDMPAYTTVNAQVSYTYKKATLRVFANNIFNELGYTSYFRGGYINEIAPRNFAAQLTYRF